MAAGMLATQPARGKRRRTQMMLNWRRCCAAALPQVREFQGGPELL